MATLVVFLDAAGGDFDGATGKGLFEPPAGTVASRQQQVRINSVMYHAEGAAHEISFTIQDPDNAGNSVLKLGGADFGLVNDATDFNWGLLPTSNAGVRWGLEFSTSGKTGDAWVTFNYQAVGTKE